MTKQNEIGEAYMEDFRWRAGDFINEAVTHYLKNGGKFEAREAAKLVRSCIDFARLSTDMLAAYGLLPKEKTLPPEGREVEDAVNNIE